MQRELSVTKQRLAELDQKLAELGGQEKTILARLDSYNERLALTRRYIAQLSGQISARTREITQVIAAIETTETALQLRRGELTRRIRTVYKTARVLPLQIAFTTKTIPELWRRVLYLRWVARADSRILAELEELNGQLVRQQAKLVASRTDLERLLRERQAQEEQLRAAQAGERALLERVRTERAANESTRVQLQAASQKLADLITVLSIQRTQESGTGSYLEQHKGQLPWPVKGKVITTFGSHTDPKYHTKTENLGVDIRPSDSTTVTAVAPGRVVFADRFIGYGNLVIIDHGAGYYTLYGNLDAIAVAVGQQLRAADVIGTCSGYLHFEVRKDGQPKNPLNWLAP